VQPSEAARGTPRSDAADAPQVNTKLGGSWSSSSANPEATQDDLAWSPADLRLVNGGLCECEAALLESTPIVSAVSWYSLLWALGVRSAAGLHFDSVVSLPGGRFDFARDVRDATGAVVALIVPAYDDTGGLDDLVALDLDRDFLATRLGRVSMLGQNNLHGWRLGEPLIIHETPLEWLQAGREGVFVIDPQRASPLLRLVEPLGVKRPEFGRQLQAALTIRAPRIVVAAQRRAA
jgi:hypothetical protein